MQRTAFSGMACSIARSLDVIGEPWTPLIVRDLWLGRRRFDEIQQNLAISRKVLAQRLTTLVEHDVVDRRRYRRQPERHEYVLTVKGRELAVVLLALMAWGDRWSAGDGPPMLLEHSCGQRCRPTITCSSCTSALAVEDLTVSRGPGARDGWGTTWPTHARDEGGEG